MTTPATTGQSQSQDLADLSDPWTPDQELTLLKALVKFKPVGLHAHFRMISIQQFLVNSGTCTAEDEHTRIPGIWAKLRTLYDLEQLDEREDAVVAVGADEDSQVDSSYWRDFELPGDDHVSGDFEKLMWDRRLAPEGMGSPAWSDEGVGRRGTKRESTVPGTDEPRSSPVASSVVRGTRSGRRGGRVSRLKGEEANEGRSSRRGSKAASEVENKDEDGDETMEDAEDDDDDGSGSGDDEDEESEEQEEDEKPGPARRGRGGRRGRGRRGRARRG